MDELMKKLTIEINSFYLSKLPEFLGEKEGYPEASVMAEDMVEFLKEIGVKDRVVKSSQSARGSWTKKGKKRLNGYNVFTQENSPEVRKEFEKKLNEMSSQERLSFISKEVSNRWKKLTDEEKKKYSDKAKSMYPEDDPEPVKKEVVPQKKKVVPKDNSSVTVKKKPAKKSKFSSVRDNDRWHLTVDGIPTNYIINNPTKLMVCAKLSSNGRQIRLSMKDIEMITTEYRLKIGTVENLPAKVKKEPPKPKKTEEEEEDEISDDESGEIVVEHSDDEGVQIEGPDDE